MPCDALGRLHEAGLFGKDLSYDRVDGVSVLIALKDARTRRLVKFSGNRRRRTCSRRTKRPRTRW